MAVTLRPPLIGRLRKPSRWLGRAMNGSSAVPLLLALSIASLGDLSGARAQASGLPPPMWLLNVADDVSLPVPSRGEELSELKAIMAEAKAEDLARMAWWNVGGPAYRWNEIAIEELLDRFVTLPLAARHLALLHAAIDDAEAVAWHYKVPFKRARPSERDPKLEARLPALSSPSYPSDFAAGTTAAVQVLASILPDRAGALAARAEEAMRSRLLAGLEYPSDVKAGREIGVKVAARAIERGKRDGSEQTWTGTVPTGPGKWQGTNPIAPSAATWRPWVLSRPDELRPPTPPPFDSERTKADLAELKGFKRTPQSNHRAVYWEVYGGARAHALWNEIARLKLLEYGKALDGRASARVLALLNIAFLDAAIACWDAKYLYWYIRPSQLDPDLKAVFPPPNHPSYPAAHGCLSTAAATVLASFFPGDADKLLALGKEAAEARVWAGIHYRFDIDAGQDIGRKVAAKVLARAGLHTGR